MMIIATYNVNSVNARLENLVEWLQKTTPDVVLLQEIKTEFNGFPFFDLQTIGYEAKILGQKSYNGVAILSKNKIKVTSEGLSDFQDDNSRYLEAEIEVENEVYTIASIYLPNGNPPYNDPDDNSKFEYKLRWMEALYKRAKYLLETHQNIILGGDFNVILTKDDVYDEQMFKNNALYREEVKQRLKAIEYLGFYDSFRALHPKEEGYTYWDYSGQAFQINNGMRIDYIFVSPSVADKLQTCEVDKAPRGFNKPSDHTALVVKLK